MNLSKKQVKGILNILKSKENVYRRGLQVVTIDKKRAFVSDGFSLLAIPLSKEYPDLEVHHEKLTRWYKLASARDTLKEDELIALAEKPELSPMKFEKIIDELKDFDLTQEINFDSKILSNLIQALGGTDERIKLKFRGKLGVISVQSLSAHEEMEAIILPIRPRN